MAVSNLLDLNPASSNNLGVVGNDVAGDPQVFPVPVGYVNFAADASEDNGNIWGDYQTGGDSGHYDARHINAGAGFVHGTVQGGDYNFSWNPTGYGYNNDQFNYNAGDTVVPYLAFTNSGMAGNTLGMVSLPGPFPLPLPELVLETPYSSLTYHGQSGSTNTGPDGSSTSSGLIDLTAWDNQTILGVRGSDGVVTPLATLNESRGFSVDVQSHNTSTAPGGTFTFDDMNADVSYVNVNPSGQVMDGGLVGATNAIWNAIDNASHNPIGAGLDTQHSQPGAFASATGSNTSMLQVALDHAGFGKG